MFSQMFVCSWANVGTLYLPAPYLLCAYLTPTYLPPRPHTYLPTDETTYQPNYIPTKWAAHILLECTFVSNVMTTLS